MIKIGFVTSLKFTIFFLVSIHYKNTKLYIESETINGAILMTPTSKQEFCFVRVAEMTFKVLNMSIKEG